MDGSSQLPGTPFTLSNNRAARTGHRRDVPYRPVITGKTDKRFHGYYWKGENAGGGIAGLSQRNLRCGNPQEPFAPVKREERERCSGSFRLAVGFLVIKDDSISERPG